jgi:hypothetical protein
LYKHPNNNNKF